MPVIGISGWVGCAILLQGSLPFARANSPQKVTVLSQHVVLIGMERGGSQYPALLLPFTKCLSLSSSFPFFKLGEGRGKRLPLISVEEKCLFCSGFWLTQQTVFKI
jgi:hypothetical protein